MRPVLRSLRETLHLLNLLFSSLLPSQIEGSLLWAEQVCLLLLWLPLLLDASVCFLVFSCSRYLDEDESALIETMVNCLLVAWTCPEAANYHILLFFLRLPMGCVSSNSVDLSFQCLAQRGNTTYTFLDISSV